MTRGFVASSTTANPKSILDGALVYLLHIHVNTSFANYPHDYLGEGLNREGAFVTRGLARVPNELRRMGNQKSLAC